MLSSAILDGIQAEIAAQGVKVDEIVAEAKPTRKKAAKKEEPVEAEAETAAATEKKAPAKKTAGRKKAEPKE